MTRTQRLPCQTAGGALLFALTCGGAAGQDISQPPQAAALTPVVVTPTRIDTPLDQIGGSISLITAEDIDAHQWRSLPQALETAPGLNVVQTGGPGGYASVFIRGADSDQTKVIIDGVDAIDPSTGAFDFGQVLTSGLARVEILRGPASSLYGPNAAGGVVNIVTADGSGPPHLTLSFEGGSFKTANQTARLAGGDTRFNYAFDFAHDFSGDTPVTPLGLLAPGEQRIGDRYDNYTFSAKVNGQLTPILGFGLVARYVMADYRFTDENYDVFPAVPDAAQSDQYERQLFTRAETRLSLLDGRFQNVLGVGYTFYHTAIQTPDDGFGLPPATIDDGDRIKVDYQGTLTLSPKATLVVGADADLDRLIDSPVTASDGYQAGFLELQAHPVQGLSVAASVRDDHDDRFGNAVTWSLAPTYVIAKTGTQLKASYGTGFRAPTLTQLYVSYPGFDFFANPNLKPETSRGYDVGFEQPVDHDRARFGATWFHNSIRDLIDTNADGTSYANIGRATTYGVESFVSFRVTPALQVSSDYTYTFARDDIADVELLRRPKDKVDVSTVWQATRRLQLSATWLYKGGWVDGSRDFSVPRLWASPYAVVNLAGAYDLGHGVSLFARIDNLANRHYEEPVGYDRPGIGVFGGVKVDLDARKLAL